VEAGYNTSTVTLRVLEEDEREPSGWEYNWAPCHWGTCSSRFGIGHKVDDLAPLKIIVTKSTAMKTGVFSSQEQTNLEVASKEDHGSEKAVLPMMMMMI
jgi:hypothetical protein